MAVILVAEADLTVGEVQQAVIGEGHPMGVAADVV